MTEANSQNHKDFDLALMVGRVEGRIGGIEGKIDVLSTAIIELTKQGNRHENIWSKFVGAASVISIGWYFVAEWIKHKIFNN